MKKVNIFLVILLLTAGCGGNKHSGNDDLIKVDVTKSYPKKELILQDFMDVEYVALETGGDFYTQALVQAIGKDIIIVTNRVRDGDIFIFDRKSGKGIRKINRQGQGPEEYVMISGVVRIILDEANGEMFITPTVGKTHVYDLYGKFKRSFMSSYYDVFEYDKDNLICYDKSDFNKRGEDREKAYHVIISKLDGSITREIYIPYKTIHTPIVRKSSGIASMPGELSQIIPHQGKWILADLSSDTLYMYSPKNILTPFLVRTPSIHVMHPEVYLSIMALTDSYYFLKTVVNDFDFETGNGFDMNSLMYDKKENAVFEYVIYNDDNTEKKPLSKMMWWPYNHEIAASAVLVPDILVEDYKKGILKGRLKEIAAKFAEDNSRIEPNPVIMLIKHKK